MGETIRRVNGYGHDAYTYYPVLIVGAGASGIAMACRLKEKLGFDQFRVFERQAGIGGTWWINRYPGVACDIPAPFYSFSFKQNPNWSSFYPPGSEIARYYHGVCEHYKITDKFELNTDVERCTWLEEEKVWEVRLRRMVAGMGDLSSRDRMKIVQEKGEAAVYTGSETVRAKVVVSCVGGLVEPKGWPDEIPGIESFKGPVFHSARWDESVDFTDKNVVVMGTGCSSAQVVPCLPEAPYNAKSVTQLMRTPPWVVSSGVPPGGNQWWRKNGARYLKAVPGLMSTLRLVVASAAEYQYLQLFPDTPFAEKQRKITEARMLGRMRKIVPEKYHEMLTPDYGIGCKRRIFDKGWFKSLNNPKIELTTQPLSRVKESSIIIGPGVTYPKEMKEELPEREVPADIIVLANGFEVTQWLHPLHVYGRDGKDLVETMEERGGPQAYLGTAFDGFPNFFIIFGPNTATGHSSVIMATENMINHSLNFIKLLLNGEASCIDVKREAEMAYTAEIQAALKKTVFMNGGCISWYYTKDGWNSTVYPYSQVDFWRRCRFPRWSDWNITYTKQGLSRMRTRQAVRILAAAVVLGGVYFMRQSGMGLGDVIVHALQYCLSNLMYATVTLKHLSIKS